MVYKWKNSGLYKIPAETAAAELEKCRDDCGIITPENVVERAKDKDNPLHGCFEWNDTKAATKWREQQARIMICNIVTLVETEGETKTITVRAFPHIQGDERGYKHINAVLENSQDRAYMLGKAKAELSSFLLKYRNLTELASVMEVIAKLLEDDGGVE